MCNRGLLSQTQEVAAALGRSLTLVGPPTVLAFLSNPISFRQVHTNQKPGILSAGNQWFSGSCGPPNPS